MITDTHSFSKTKISMNYRIYLWYFLSGISKQVIPEDSGVAAQDDERIHHQIILSVFLLPQKLY